VKARHVSERGRWHQVPSQFENLSIPAHAILTGVPGGSPTTVRQPLGLDCGLPIPIALARSSDTSGALYRPASHLRQATADSVSLSPYVCQLARSKSEAEHESRGPCGLRTS
jgi:hypothetical protein